MTKKLALTIFNITITFSININIILEEYFCLPMCVRECAYFPSLQRKTKDFKKLGT